MPEVDPLVGGLATYRQKPTPQNLNGIVQHLQPTIDQALKVYAKTDSPVVRSRARVMAARAVKSFDPTFGASLQTHVMRQLQALQRVAPTMQEPMAMPERLRRDRGAVLRAIDETANELGREASDEEVAERTQLPVKRVVKVRQLMRAGVPLSQIESADDDDGEDADSDMIASQTTPEDDWIDAVYHDLGDVDRIILQYRTGYRGAEKLSNNEIARKLNLSPSAVTQRATRIQARIDEFYR